MVPALEDVAEERAGAVKIVKLDVDRSPIVKGEYKIHGMPTLILFKEGEPVARRTGGLVQKEKLEEWIDAALVLALADKVSSVPPRAVGFRLRNGLEVVVIADRRAPIVSHMVCYKAGAADEPAGGSGVARFLQQLTVKSMDKVAVGEFSKTMSRLGGEHKACATLDTTIYYERIAKEQLKTAMEMEADRMIHLYLTEEEVSSEREVITELRALSDPLARLFNYMQVAIFPEHPYGYPAIPLAGDVVNVSRREAMRFYKRYYAPNNAVLVVSGDVTPEEVKHLAEETYGKILANPDLDTRSRSKEPVPSTAQRVTLRDARATTSTFRRYYAVPSYVTAKRGVAEALEVLVKILAGGQTSRLYQKLVIADRLVATIGGGYAGTMLKSGVAVFHAVSRSGAPAAIEAAVDGVLEDIRTHGVTQVELARAKKALLARYIFDSSNQERLTGRYGWAVAIGRTVDQIESWPAAISGVTAEDIKRAAAEHLDIGRSVTGWLLPESDKASSAQAMRPLSRASL
jgi:zinc protease